MAIDGWIVTTGAKQGQFKGQNQVAGRANSSAVIKLNYEIVAPRDAQHGLATGRREHHPVIVEMPLDSAAINWKTAITNNETLTSVKINFHQTVTHGLTQGTAAGSGGDKTPFYTIELKNAVVSQLEFIQPFTRSTDPEVKNREMHLRVHLTFMEITCTWVQGGITMNDSWLAGSQ